jgi:hypothetical protein
MENGVSAGELVAIKPDIIMLGRRIWIDRPIQEPGCRRRPSPSAEFLISSAGRTGSSRGRGGICGLHQPRYAAAALSPLWTTRTRRAEANSSGLPSSSCPLFHSPRHPDLGKRPEPERCGNTSPYAAPHGSASRGEESWCSCGLR